MNNADKIRQKVKTARKFETRKIVCNEWRDEADEKAGVDFVVYVKSHRNFTFFTR